LQWVLDAQRDHRAALDHQRAAGAKNIAGCAMSNQFMRQDDRAVYVAKKRRFVVRDGIRLHFPVVTHDMSAQETTLGTARYRFVYASMRAPRLMRGARDIVEMLRVIRSSYRLVSGHATRAAVIQHSLRPAKMALSSTRIVRKRTTGDATLFAKVASPVSEPTAAF